jgi:hypothetical protein
MSLFIAQYYIFYHVTNMKYVSYRLREITDFDFDSIDNSPRSPKCQNEAELLSSSRPP